MARVRGKKANPTRDKTKPLSPPVIRGEAQNEFSALEVSNRSVGGYVLSSLLWCRFGVGRGYWGKKNFQRMDQLCVRFDTTKWFVIFWLFPVWPLGSYTLVERRTFWDRKIVSAVNRPFDRGQVRMTILKAVTLFMTIIAIDVLIVTIVDRLFPP